MSLKPKETSISRRDLLKKSAVFSLVGGLGLSSTSVWADDKKGVDEIFDIIVVGSGFAGLSAAVQAMELGNSVLVVERMPVCGGNSAINGGAMAVVGSKLQRQKGISDSPESMANDMLNAGRGMNDKAMLQLVAAGTGDAADWLENYGVLWQDKVMQFGGHAVPRVLKVKQGSGSGIVRPLLKSARKGGVTVRENTRFDGFIMNEQQRVVGIDVTTNCVYPKTTGQAQRYGARKGVIMATGGFGQDVAFRSIHQPMFNDDFGTTNQPGATADALKQMLRIGGHGVHLDQIQLGPWCSPDESSNVVASKFFSTIIVNPQTGQRFYNERADRKSRIEKIVTLRQPNGEPIYPISITNARRLAFDMSEDDIQRGIKAGVLKRSDSLQELADHYDMPAENLKAQFAAWHDDAQSGKDQQFEREISSEHSLQDGPWYSLRIWPKVHYCMGGIRVNSQSEVVNVVDDTAIPGLFAAGEATGGIHGASRLGGCSIPECVVTGRNAAVHANQSAITTA